MKFLLVICFVGVFASVAPQKSVWIGVNSSALDLIFKKTVTKLHVDGEVQKEVVHYSGDVIISGIGIADWILDKGADFKLIEGGPGHKSVTIELVETGRGIHTCLTVYGKK